MSLSQVKHIVLVLSGKGGVGKSSVTTQLALTLSLSGFSVGVLDVDLTGPSMPRMFGVESGRVTQSPQGWLSIPVHDASPTRGPLTVMSLGFLLPGRSDAVVWRGPKKTAMVRQFLRDVHWGPLDFLLVDTPPGTSDEHMALAETLLGGRDARPDQLAGAVVVTTPQAVATSDVRRALNFCAKTGVGVLGVVENMSGFVCPNCSECTNIFMSGGGRVTAADFGVRFLGAVPIDPQWVVLVETGRRPMYPAGTVVNKLDVSERHGARDEEGLSLADKYTSCSLAPVFANITRQLVGAIQVT